MTANSTTLVAGVSLAFVAGTAAYVSASTLAVPAGATATVVFSGTYAATAQLEQAVNDDQQAWFVPRGGGPFSTANATQTFTYTAPLGPEAYVYLRLNCTAYTSGTLNGSATIVARQTLTFTDILGNTLITGSPSGLTVVPPITFSGGAAVTNTFLTGGVTAAANQTPTPAGINLLSALAGTTSILPAATGSGKVYKFLVSVVPTSNSHIITCSAATSTFVGSLGSTVASTGAAKAYVPTAGATGTGSDTVTLAPATTGGFSIGDWIEVTDLLANVYSIKGVVSVGAGSQATPFSTVA